MAAAASAPMEAKPRILLMGMRRSGKTSIQKVVFHKLSPHETLFLEGTTKIIKTDISNSALLQFEVWDFPPPGPTDFTDHEAKWTPVFAACSTLVWVIDVQDEYAESIARLQAALAVALRARGGAPLACEVVVHKTDSLSEDQKFEVQRDVHAQVSEELSSLRSGVPLRVFLTSIYDHSIFEALSKVVQRLLAPLPALQHLLDVLLSKAAGEKAFLFDMVSKLYLATDSSPVDMQLYELCADVIDVVIDVTYIYAPRPQPQGGAAGGAAAAGQPGAAGGAAAAGGGADGAARGGAGGADGGAAEPDDGPAAAPGATSSAVIRLSNGSVLHLRPVDEYVALVVVMSEHTLQRQGLVEVNFQCFREAVRSLFPAKRALAAAEV